MIRQAHLMAVVGTFMMGCAVLLFVGCAGVRPEASEGEGRNVPVILDIEWVERGSVSFRRL